MATDTLTGGIRPVNTPNHFPPAALALLDRFNRDDLGNAIEVLVALLDAWDGDSDDENATDLEDDFALSGLARGYAKGRGPGCDIADSGENAWIEWHAMRGSQKRGSNITQAHEDAEDDDPAGQYDEDYYTGPAKPGYGPGCTISDDDHGIDDLRQGTPGLDC